MRTREELKRLACEAIDKNRERIIAFGDAIAAEPELGFKEYKTAAKFKALLEELDFDYRDGIALTGIVARRKGAKSKASVAIMAEMDAVIVPGHPCAVPETGAVHACGHNCMMAALAGVAMALKDTGLMEELCGDIVLMAVPAEEYVEIEYRNSLREQGKIHFLGGKQEFIRLGEMDNIDMMLMQHTVISNDVYKAGAGSPCNGFTGKLIRYIGKEAHAGAAPYDGVNALNAAMLGLMAVHAQRETFRDEDSIRVHPIITKGGDLVNVVPSDVRLETYVRGSNTKAIKDASKKVNRAFRSGGDAVGAETVITELPGYLPAVLNDKLMDLMYENLKALVGEENALRTCAGFGGGSSDQGDVSQLMPSLQAFFSGAIGGLHQESFALEDKDMAYITAAKALIMLAIDLLAEDAGMALDVKEGFTPTLTKEEYLSDWGGIK